MAAQPAQGRKPTVIAGWLAVAAASAAVIAFRLDMTVDLAFFLPAPTTEQEQVLIDRLGQGPGSRLIFISVPGTGRAELQTRSARLRALLGESALFSRVLNGQEELSVASIPDEVWRYRYLLSDIDWSVDGLRAAMQERLADLSVLSGQEITRLIGADPYLASVDVMQALAGPGDRPEAAWIDPEKGFAHLIAETAAPAFDVAGQARAVRFITDGVASLNAGTPELNGVGAYSVALQTTIRSEARNRSLIATAAIMTALFIAYRRFSLIVLAATPLLLGGLAGLAVVALLFGEVHGITLAFGFTLFGVAVDYPLHLFSHAHSRPPRAAILTVWRTLRLGALSTVIAYLALVASGSRGLAQLGCLSAVGVIVALYATRTLLPQLMPPSPANGAVHPGGGAAESRPRLRHGVWLAAIAVGAVLLAPQRAIWTNDLASLTPLPVETLRRDNALRELLGAPDIRYLLLLQAPTEERALVSTERLQDRLADARQAGLVENTLTVTGILPSRLSQEERRAALPSAEHIEALVNDATNDTPFKRGAFSAFISHVQATRDMVPLTSADIRDPLLRSFVGNHFYFDGKRWNSAVTLYGLTDAGRLQEWLDSEAPEVRLIDLKGASESLVRNYRVHIVTVLAAALGAIALLLVWRIGLSARLLWVIGTLSGAIVLTIAISALMLGQLSIFNLIALVLVAGLGFDYALFMSRTERGADEALQTRHALRVCAGSTLAAFAVLAFSSVPILASIGITVATGVLLNYALAWTGAPRSARA